MEEVCKVGPKKTAKKFSGLTSFLGTEIQSSLKVKPDNFMWLFWIFAGMPNCARL